MSSLELEELKNQIQTLKIQLKNEQERSSYNCSAFETIYKCSSDGVLLIEDGKFVNCNDAIIKLLHCDSEEQVLNMHPSQLSPELQPDGSTSLEKANKMMQQAVDKGYHRFEWVHKRVDGEEFWADVVLTKLVLDLKDVIHATVRDISGQKKLETDILKERDLANQANQFKSEFLANISHELRTPMHGILSFADFGLQNYATASHEKLEKYFSHIKISGVRLLSLLNDLLDLAKLESGQLELNYSPSSLNLITERCIAEQKARLIELDKTITWLPESISGVGVFDEELIGQVITNFLSNAIKFTPGGAAIELLIEKTELEINNEQKIPALLFIIRDDGEGLAEDEFELLFDKFKQSSVNKSQKGGTGLGLSICKEIIEAHSGNIWAENHFNGGAIFQFVIPVSEVIRSRVS